MTRSWVGIQIAPISFVDEGVENILDILQEKAAVNVLVLMPLSWLSSVGGRTSLNYVDHGIPGPFDPAGGAFWDPDPRYYGHTCLKHFRSPDPLLADFDALGDVIPEARRRGMKVYAYNWEITRRFAPPNNVPNFAQVLEMDVRGRRSGAPCFNNPDYQGWILGVMNEWCQRYDVDGILWGIERQGPLTGTVVYGHVPVCFCEHCQARGARAGIDLNRAREGYLILHTYLDRVRAREEPRDGAFVMFLRLLFENPEMLQWEKLWFDSQRAFYRELYGLVKFLDPEKELGLGILQWISSFNPYLLARHDYAELIGVCDWVKPVLYHVPAGARFRAFTESLRTTILKDLSLDACVEGLYRVLDLDEAPAAELAGRGFSPDYVQNQTARFCRALQGHARVYPGIGVSLPSPDRRINPQDMREAVRAAFAGGADGILLARNYAEATLANLEAVGDEIRSLEGSDSG
jgi:hypothetical protein